MKEVTVRLDAWRKQYPNLFEYRLLPILPALGSFITDQEGNRGTVKVEIYTAKQWRPIDSRPHFVLSSLTPEWRAYFVNQWENYWNLARAPQA